MTNLLDFALETHGAFANWKCVTGVDLRLTLGGYHKAGRRMTRLCRRLPPQFQSRIER
jgi:hypothetical protein